MGIYPVIAVTSGFWGAYLQLDNKIYLLLLCIGTTVTLSMADKKNTLKSVEGNYTLHLTDEDIKVLVNSNYHKVFLFKIIIKNVNPPTISIIIETTP